MSAGSQRPFFIVGCGRSGTTLVRVMLDCHPRLAIPPESHFVVQLTPGRFSRRREATLEDVLDHPKFGLWGIDRRLVRDFASNRTANSFTDVIATVFACYAHSEGKARWGDKTPAYVSYIPLIRRHFPNAQFIHVIRDGREVAVSLAEQRWGPRTAISGAYWWRQKVRRGVRAGRNLPPDSYLELRVEDLIDDPEEVLKGVCHFLGEDYAPEMLDYPRRYPNPASHLAKPPTRGLRDWRAGLSERDQDAVEAVCGPLLRQLGYDGGAGSVGIKSYAAFIRWRDQLLATPRLVRGLAASHTQRFYR